MVQGRESYLPAAKDPRRERVESGGTPSISPPSHGFANSTGCFPHVTDARRYQAWALFRAGPVGEGRLVSILCLTYSTAHASNTIFFFFNQGPLNAIFSLAVSAVYFQGKSSCLDQPWDRHSTYCRRKLPHQVQRPGPPLCLPIWM